MLTLAVILNLLVGAGTLAMAAKYLTTASPIDYHGEILKAETVSAETKQILKAMYRCMGAGFAGLGVMVIVLTLFGVWADVYWAKLAILLGAGTVGVLVSLAGRETEMVTGVKTPWRVAVGLVGLAVVAFLVSLF